MQDRVSDQGTTRHCENALESLQLALTLSAPWEPPPRGCVPCTLDTPGALETLDTAHICPGLINISWKHFSPNSKYLTHHHNSLCWSFVRHVPLGRDVFVLQHQHISDSSSISYTTGVVNLVYHYVGLSSCGLYSLVWSDCKLIINIY